MELIDRMNELHEMMAKDLVDEAKREHEKAAEQQLNEPNKSRGGENSKG